MHFNHHTAMKVILQLSRSLDIPKCVSDEYHKIAQHITDQQARDLQADEDGVEKQICRK